VSLPFSSLVLATSLAATLPSCGRPERPDSRPATVQPVTRGVGYSKPYRFTTDWYSRNIPVWSTTLGPLRGRPGLRYLEVGVYEGRSLLWVLENVLTDPTSRLTGLDLEMPVALRSNIEMSGQAGKITTIEGPSQTELRKLPVSSFDIIYIDGSHVSADVLADAVQCFELLKDGGLMIFDDYAWVGGWVTRKGELLPDQLRPRMAIDAFIASYHYELKVVRSGYQMIVRKSSDPCRKTRIQGQCSPFGQYVYDWAAERLLVAGHPSQALRVSPTEKDLIESVLRTKDPDGKIRSGPGFVALGKRLQLEL
jgi:predicted O-methyltransferase YrrM